MGLCEGEEEYGEQEEIDHLVEGRVVLASKVVLAWVLKSLHCS